MEQEKYKMMQEHLIPENNKVPKNEKDTYISMTREPFDAMSAAQTWDNMIIKMNNDKNGL